MLSRRPLTIKDIRAFRKDYGMLVETLVSGIYHRFVQPGHHVIDAGANAGMHLFPLAQIVGKTGSVTAFEPNPELVAKLRQRAENAAQIHIHERALSDKEGMAEFVIYLGNSGLSHLSHSGSVHPEAKGLKSRRVSVETVRLDSYLKDPIAFIKSDLEGADFLGLRGAERILTECRPLIIAENGRAAAAQRFQFTTEDYFGYVAKVGYRIFDVHGMPLTPQSWSSDNVGWEAIFIPEEAEYTATILTFVQKFWSSVSDWPVITAWKECAELGKLLPSLRQI
jgi:FkbM family methyltransferase